MMPCGVGYEWTHEEFHNGATRNGGKDVNKKDGYRQLNVRQFLQSA